MMIDPMNAPNTEIAHNLGMSGAVSVERGSDVLNGLPMGAAIYEQDRIRCHGAAAASIEFLDGGRLHLGAGTVCTIVRFAYDRPHDTVTSFMELSTGAFLFSASGAAASADAIQLNIGDVTLQVFAARVAGVQLDEEHDLFALLPGRRADPNGEVLVATKTGVSVLDGPWACVRVARDGGSMTEPISMPSSLLLDVFDKSGVHGDLTAIARESPVTDPLTASGFDIGAASVEPFHALNDRLFERRFIPGQLYPDEGSRAGEGQTDLLEDAFEGRRFSMESDS